MFVLKRLVVSLEPSSRNFIELDLYKVAYMCVGGPITVTEPVNRKQILCCTKHNYLVRTINEDGKETITNRIT